MLFILYSNKFADLKRESVTNTQKSLHLLFWNLKKEINLFMFKSIFEIIRWIDLSLGQFKILLCLFGVEIYSITGCISIWQYLIVEHI